MRVKKRTNAGKESKTSNEGSGPWTLLSFLYDFEARWKKKEEENVRVKIHYTRKFQSWMFYSTSFHCALM